MALKPKLCINSSCRNILYVPAEWFHQCLECSDCATKRSLRHDL